MKSWYNSLVWGMVLGWAAVNYGMKEPGTLSTNKENTSGVISAPLLSSFKQQLKDLLANPMYDSKKYRALVRDMQTLYGNVSTALLFLVQDKKIRAFEKIQEEWEIPGESVEFLGALYYGELKVQNSEVICTLHAPHDRIDYFKKQINTTSFKKLLNKYLSWCPAKKLNINFFGSSNYVFTQENEAPVEKQIAFGPIYTNPFLNLSEDFFEYSEAKREFTIAHEMAHLVMNHSVMTKLLHNYCVDSFIIKAHLKLAPTLKEWLYADPKFNWKSIVEIFNNNPDKRPILSSIILESLSFLSLAHAKEYEADSLFSILNVNDTHMCEQALLEMIAATNSDVSLPDKKETHPALSKRFRWMHVIGKLLETEEKLQKNKELHD